MENNPIQFLKMRPEAVIPRKSTQYATGYDLFACLPGQSPLSISHGEILAIPTGLNMSFQPGEWDVQIRSRSGLAAKGILVMNSPGTIDADYSGVGPNYEVKVILGNFSRAPFVVEQGMRIGQMVFARLGLAPEIIEVQEEEFVVSTADRTGGFGSTGVR